ncbi:hypothetical protein Q3G72_003188 [Acer saccharum]|nr:hypothetical protein Q3G72_003188 [Acer saccharum]
MSLYSVLTSFVLFMYAVSDTIAGLLVMFIVHGSCISFSFALFREELRNIRMLMDCLEFPIYQLHKRPGSSGPSRDQSEDDDATTDNIDPADEKPVQRMLPNRESVRHSRRRKQAHLTELELEAYVSQLTVENSSLLKRGADIRQKFNEAGVKNRVLKANVETLRAKMKMAEESIKRMAGLNPMFHAAILELSTMNLPSDSSADGAVPDPIVNNGLADISSADNVQPNPEAATVAGNKIGLQLGAPAKADSWGE